MKRPIQIILSMITATSFATITLAQDTIHHVVPEGYDPHYDKIIPDGVFEIGIPLLFLFLLVNAIVSIFKIRAETRLKEKVLEKQVSDSTLITLLSVDKSLSKYSYLKWFLILEALGISFIVIILLSPNPSSPNQGYLSLGIISLLMSFAFLIYYVVISRK